MLRDFELDRARTWLVAGACLLGVIVAGAAVGVIGAVVIVATGGGVDS